MLVHAGIILFCIWFFTFNDKHAKNSIKGKLKQTPQLNGKLFVQRAPFFPCSHVSIVFSSVCPLQVEVCAHNCVAANAVTLQFHMVRLTQNESTELTKIMCITTKWNDTLLMTFVSLSTHIVSATLKWPAHERQASKKSAKNKQTNCWHYNNLYYV